MRYAGVMDCQSGPIERIEIGRFEDNGICLTQANAYLSSRLNLKVPELKIFNGAEGSGVDPSLMVARHMAISEALERWAVYFLYQTGERESTGLDKDPSSTGVAAYPGMFPWQARKRALTEAAERYCLVAWWEGMLGCRQISIPDWKDEAIEIENPLTRDRVVVCWRQSRMGFFSYGFGASPNLKRAVYKAGLERERANRALSRFHRENPRLLPGDLCAIENDFERRVVFFSLQKGHRQFLDRVHASRLKDSSGRFLEPVLDCRLRGPWDSYTTVWRVLYPMPGKDYLGTREDYFYW